MRLKVIQLRTPEVKPASGVGNTRIGYPASQVVNADTGEPIVGVQDLQVRVTNRGNELTMVVLDVDVEMRDREPGEKLVGEG